MKRYHETMGKLISGLDAQLNASIMSKDEKDDYHVECPSALLENNSIEDLLKGLQKKLFQDNSELPDFKKVLSFKEVSLNYEAFRGCPTSSTLASIEEENI